MTENGTSNFLLARFLRTVQPRMGTSAAWPGTFLQTSCNLSYLQNKDIATVNLSQCCNGSCIGVRERVKLLMDAALKAGLAQPA
jgi:hypothetical protein